LELGLEDFVIASGLARGIDIVYPPENADLQRAIGEQGLLLSEQSPGFAPRGKDFPPATA
jgi:DNA processing protein